MYFGGFEHTNLEAREDFGYASRRKKDRLAYFQKIDSCAKTVLKPLKLCISVNTQVKRFL